MEWDKLLLHYFSKLGLALSKNFALYTTGALSACSSSTQQIARYISQRTAKPFNTSDKGLAYLLCNQRFQIDDRFWRMHIGMVFSLVQEQQLFSPGDKIPIQVDFTSNKNHFLILSASIIVGNRAVPIYFTMRNYPKRKASYDHKKMELAFLKGLKHALSKRFSYIIIADRGFGNARFTQACQATGLDYIVRIQPHMHAEFRGQKGILADLFKKDAGQNFHLGPWDGPVQVCRHTHEGTKWYLVSNINDMSSEQYVCHYRNRFKIEKCFQDLKSSGFDLESSKIRKYDRYKKLLAICIVAHTLLVIAGYIIREKMPQLLKNSPFCANVHSVFFLSENMPSFIRNLLQSKLS